MLYAHSLLRASRSTLLVGAALAGTFSSVSQAEWTKAFSLRIEEGYDSNVYLQDETSLGNQDSFITVIQPKVDLGWLSTPLNFNLTYAPKVSIFGSERTENNVAHALGLNFKGHITDSLSYEFLNSLNYINGSRTALTYRGEGGAPAFGAYTVRDRREAAWMKQSAKLTWNLGPVFLRPVYDGYMHDFKTIQKQEPGYQNYVDRFQFNGGLDVGYKILKETYFVTGYRYGIMKQDRIFDSPLKYNNTFHRALFGLEGKPLSWIKICALAGPSFHHFNDSVPEAFGRNHIRVYADATVTLTPTASDSFILATTRFEGLSHGGKGSYQDIVYRAGYVRKLTEALDLKADFKLYRGEWEATANRKDNIYTPSLGLVYKVNKYLTCDCLYSYEWSQSDVPNSGGREYNHHLASIGATVSF